MKTLHLVAMLAVAILLIAASTRVEGNNLIVEGTATVASRGIPNIAPNDGGTAQIYIEFGYTTLSTGTKTVTFRNAYTVKPACFCTDGTALALCDIPVATVSTTQFVVNGTGSDVISWQCMGDR